MTEYSRNVVLYYLCIYLLNYYLSSYSFFWLLSNFFKSY